MFDIPKKNTNIIRNNFLSLNADRNSSLENIEENIKGLQDLTNNQKFVDFLGDKQDEKDVQNLLKNLSFFEEKEEINYNKFADHKNKCDYAANASDATNTSDAEFKAEILSILGKNKRRVFSSLTLTYHCKLSQGIHRPTLFLKQKANSMVTIPSNGKCLHEVPERLPKPIYKNLRQNSGDDYQSPENNF